MSAGYQPIHSPFVHDYFTCIEKGCANNYRRLESSGDCTVCNNPVHSIGHYDPQAGKHNDSPYSMPHQPKEI